MERTALVLTVLMGFTFWSGAFKVCRKNKNKVECKVSQGLFRGNTETGEVHELVRFEDEYRQAGLDAMGTWLLIEATK